MFTIAFYESTAGRSDVFELLEKLEIKARTNKQDRVRFAKIVEYIILNHRTKSKGKTPQKELALANMRKRDYIEREVYNA